MPEDIYNEDYFERGLETGISCYQNYRWIPELTIPMAMRIIDYLGIPPKSKILDLGCAKGYLVKAFRWLNREAWGIDISKYALGKCDPEIIGCCWSYEDMCYFGPDHFDYIVAKDVFEHIPVTDLQRILESISQNNGKDLSIFVIVPLGEDGVYTAPANNLDKTHVNCMNDKDWKVLFEACHLKVERFAYQVEGIKESYYKEYPKAHGFFTLRNV